MEKINNSNWIRDSVWCLMIGKAKAMRLITGYPKQFANESLVEAFFAAFPRARNKFFTPYMKSHRLLTTRIFKEQATENFTLSSVNAYYLGSRNTITIYPGLLQPPFFFKDAPAAINYGGLGQVVGHEIMHAFDADGITYSYRYIRHKFDNTMTMKEYKKKLLCIRASYERHSIQAAVMTTSYESNSTDAAEHGEERGPFESWNVLEENYEHFGEGSASNALSSPQSHANGHDAADSDEVVPLRRGEQGSGLGQEEQSPRITESGGNERQGRSILCRLQEVLEPANLGLAMSFLVLPTMGLVLVMTMPQRGCPLPPLNSLKVPAYTTIIVLSDGTADLVMYVTTVSMRVADVGAPFAVFLHTKLLFRVLLFVWHQRDAALLASAVE
ncbi:hypothetical protein V5799_017860, partial [Amblyomma americanum]